MSSESLAYAREAVPQQKDATCPHQSPATRLTFRPETTGAHGHCGATTSARPSRSAVIPTSFQAAVIDGYLNWDAARGLREAAHPELAAAVEPQLAA